MTHHRISVALLAVAAAGLAACSNGGGDDSARVQDTGTLSVHLMDAPLEGVTAVHVEIAGLSVKPVEGDEIELDIGAETVTVDLLELTADEPAVLVDGAELPAGEYAWLRMRVNAEHDGIMDSYAMTDVGGQEEVEIRVPSGVIRLVSGFELEGGQAMRLLFDWGLRHALIDPPGLPGFLLKPAFRVLRVDEYGALSGMVDPLTLDDASCTNDDEVDIEVGNVVYVYEGHDVDPVDIDGADPEPFATAEVAQNIDGDYVYRVLLMPGDYTVAFSCEAGNDLPESSEAITFLGETEIVVELDEQTLDF